MPHLSGTNVSHRIRRRLLNVIAVLAGPLALLAGCASPGSASWDRPAELSDLDRWIDAELTPALSHQLASYPRFSGETMMVAALQGERLSRQPDALTARVRDHLRKNLAGEKGVRLAWSGAAVRCQTPAGVNYLIGVEINEAGGGDHHVLIRVLDRGERTWVAGVAYEWRGRLERREREARARMEDAEALKGVRDTPFVPGEEDRLAAALAADLVCQFGDRRLRFAVDESALQGPDRNLVALLEAYLAEAGLARADSAERADISVVFRRHPIEQGLDLVWISARAAQPGFALPGAEAQAYVRMDTVPPTRDMLHERRNPSEDPDVQAASPVRSALVSGLRRLAPRDNDQCAERRPWVHGSRLIEDSAPVDAGDCFDLELVAHRPVTVFLFRARPDSGFLPEGGLECRGEALAGIELGTGQRLRWTDGARERALGWMGRGGIETFYAVAISDSDGAARMRALTLELASGCQASRRTGMRSEPDREWIAELGRLLYDLDTRASWQALRLRHRG